MGQISKLFSWLNLLISLVFIIIFLASFLFSPDSSPSLIFFSGFLSLYCLGNSIIFFKIQARNKEKIETLKTQSIYDDFAGLFTLSRFKLTLEGEFKKAKRTGKSLGTAIIEVNLENSASEKLEQKNLQEIVSFLQKKTRAGEMLTLFNKKSFAILISDSSPSEIFRGISRLQSELEEKIHSLGDNKEKFPVKIGLAIFPKDANSSEELLAMAEKHLHKAKASGVKIYSSTGNLQKFEMPRNTSFHSDRYFLDKIAKKSTQLFLLFQEKEVEIIKQKIDANKRFVIEKAEGLEGFEFFYILEGEILHVEQDRVLSSGYFIKTGSEEKRIHFKTLTPVSFLYITNLPVFIEQTNEIKKMAEMIDRAEQKDIKTESHGFRLQEMAVQIVEEMEKVDDDKLFALIYAAYLHDIGKLKVPTYILRKEGPLTEEEWGIIKQHPTWGREIIEEKLQNSNTPDIAEIVHQHHENFDGSGYPQGLKGDQIRIEAQILSLLDTYDSMTSDRPYQKAMTKEEAIKEIKRCSGTKFNPEIVKHFLKIIEKSKETKF